MYLISLFDGKKYELVHKNPLTFVCNSKSTVLVFTYSMTHTGHN